MVDSVPGRRRRWQFDWRLLLFSGLFLPLLLALGFWQIDRAAQKQQQLDRWDRQSTQLAWAEQLNQGVAEGQPVTVDGHYGDKTWLLDNRTRDGIAGYEVLTLFQPVAGEALIVNRGWVQAPRRRDELPQIDTPPGNVVLAGRLDEYPEPPVLVETTGVDTRWPRRVQALTQSDAEADSPELAPMILRLQGPDQPGAYRADWAPDRMGPQTHYGYAVQWFSLATALVILTVVASYRKTEQNNDNG
ncbi:SURF1 family protein [Marinobacter sp. CHS3-4]|uniref:SURF1 family protein n=1 Tax=Marinobacter sp. CHS3-4 TaxID=3045174 RepID=UPI0024B57D26|nr:SURF1 family protein [Marinobacter sp. CHS3-4]MDI9243742.1 SURF1 family protein [Marinobacter sp. CHS3-4]